VSTLFNVADHVIRYAVHTCVADVGNTPPDILTQNLFGVKV